jgi:hypothetical protein
MFYVYTYTFKTNDTWVSTWRIIFWYGGRRVIRNSESLEWLHVNLVLYRITHEIKAEMWSCVHIVNRVSLCLHGTGIVTENVIISHVVSKIPRVLSTPMFHYHFRISTSLGPVLFRNILCFFIVPLWGLFSFHPGSRDSSAGIATGFGLDCKDSIPRKSNIFLSL